MEKRVERNRQLYKEVDKKIADIARQKSNHEFENTNNTLKSINPGLFDENHLVNTTTNKSDSNKKNIILTTIIFFALIIFIIGLAVILYYATK